MLQMSIGTATISFIKTFLLFVAFTKLEDTYLALIVDPYTPKLVEQKRGLHLLTIMMTLVSFVYSVVKGALVLNAFLNFAHYTPMHVTYNALLIAAVVFSLLEFLASLLCAKYLRRLSVIRIEHQLIEDEEKKDDKKPKANLKRVMGLAKQVSIICNDIRSLKGYIESFTTFQKQTFLCSVLIHVCKEAVSLGRGDIIVYLCKYFPPDMRPCM